MKRKEFKEQRETSEYRQSKERRESKEKVVRDIQDVKMNNEKEVKVLKE